MSKFKGKKYNSIRGVLRNLFMKGEGLVSAQKPLGKHRFH